MEGPQIPNADNKKGITRGNFLKKLAALGVVAAATPVTELFSQNTLEQNRSIQSCEMKDMPDHNLPEGFSRKKVNLEFNDGKGIREGAGSFFSMENSQKAKAEFISMKTHPEFFQNGIDFDAIKNFYKSQNKKITLTVAGAYNPGTKEVEGIALEKGRMVGQTDPKTSSNGLLVIKDGNPEIQFMNQISDFPGYVEQLKNDGADLFQQKSFIRPGSNFTSSNNTKYELRFFIEGQDDQGIHKEGVLNFSEMMNFTEAVEAMKNMKGFTVTKAIGLDTGNLSEGYFYDKNEKSYLMIDEHNNTNSSGVFDKNISIQHRQQFTNVLVLYSQN